MSAQILDGQLLAAQLKEQLAKEIAEYKSSTAKVPKIVSIIVGDDPSSLSYVVSQQKAAEAVGILYELRKVSQDISEEEFYMKVIEPLNRDESVNGILLNKPLPSQCDFDWAMSFIDPMKNIEGINSLHFGDLLLGHIKIVPCTSAAALALLKSSGVSLRGKNAVIIGRSNIVGKPMALLLLAEDMTVTVCHSKTTDLQNHLKQADVVIAAIGKPLFVKGEWIKPGAIVVDVGINQVDGKIVGDVDFESCKEKASFITPVPGGVGPVTSVMLMKNALEAFKQSL